MKINKLALSLCLAGAVQMASAGQDFIGTVTSHNDVYLSGAASRMKVETHSPQMVVAGDEVSTAGSDSWAAVRMGRDGLIEVGPESAIGFDKVDKIYRTAIREGGLRYALEDGAALVVEANGSLVIIGSEGSSGLIKVAAAPGAVGAVVVDDGRILIRNNQGDVKLVNESGRSIPVPAGQMVAFQGGAALGSTTGFQVGGPATPPAKKKKKRGAAWWGKRAGIILGTAAVLYAVKRQTDDDPPASPN